MLIDTSPCVCSNKRPGQAVFGRPAAQAPIHPTHGAFADRFPRAAAIGGIAGAAFGLESSARLRDERARAARAETLRVRAELAALRAQLNPHFLFNTLHTVLGLVRRDPALAEEALPELNGLGVLQAIHHQPAVVFTTAHDRYAVAAFEVQAIDYLLKPFGRRRLLQALERVRGRLANVRRARIAMPPGEPGPLLRLARTVRGELIPLHDDERRLVVVLADRTEIVASRAASRRLRELIA